jgi:apolipoprotein N-acyltransferase
MTPWEQPEEVSDPSDQCLDFLYGKNMGSGEKEKDLIRNSSIVAALIVLPMIISVIKYNNFDEKPTGQVNVLMLQPDLDPYAEKYSKDSLTIEQDLLALAEKNSTGKIDYYMAPETALPGRGSISETAFERACF